jgi:hypothetical protein
MECWALNPLLQYSSIPSLHSFNRITVVMWEQESDVGAHQLFGWLTLRSKMVL